nr:serine carboxypeptidase-like 45 [Ipomoea batatas]
MVESSSLSAGDRISSGLPGQPQVCFSHYSGYVTIDEEEGHQRALFYYFVEAEVDPSSKPLVLWLNGGPGCSSLGVGAFSENGPFRPSGNVLVRNEYSWNTAMDNLVFLQKWYLKFPQYRNTSLFIAGESYAGHYVPQLAQMLLQSNKEEKLFNLKGIALGNPVLEFATDLNSRAEYFWSHGLISDTTYKLFTSACNYSRYVSEYYRGSLSPVCARVMSIVSRETSRFVDNYDVTLDVCISSVFSQSKVLNPQTRCSERNACTSGWS